MNAFRWKKRHRGKLDQTKTDPLFSVPSVLSNTSDSPQTCNDDGGREDEIPDIPVPSSSSSSSNSTDGQQFQHIRERGTRLAELGRYWEALHVWRPLLTPVIFSESTASITSPASFTTASEDALLWEMVCQVQSELGEVYPALESGCISCRLSPLWWQSHITTARALINAGEPGLARRQLSVARHLRPDQVPVVPELLDACRLVRASLDRARHQQSLTGDDDVSGDEQNVVDGPSSCTVAVCTDVAGVISQEQSDFVRALLQLSETKVSVKLPDCGPSWFYISSDLNHHISEDMEVDNGII